MIHVYYHIYAIDGVESIVDEQLELINTFFDFNYILNIGISIANENQSICNIIEKFNKPNFKIREVRAFGNEFTTIDLIEKDKQKFGNSDYILYLHTKGASKQHNENVIHWRHLMNYFNIEKVKNVFKLFEKTDYNTYGVLLCKINGCTFYSGNFWWTKGSYYKKLPKTISNYYTAPEDYICKSKPNSKVLYSSGYEGFGHYKKPYPFSKYIDL